MNAARALLAAFAFLTKLPVGRVELSERDLGRSIAFFPVVGLALGLLLAGAERLASPHFPVSVRAVLLAALVALSTGGLHLDGLADVTDGLSGGKGDRDRALEIMRQGRIGAHGAVAIVLALALEIVALAALLERGDERLLVAFPVAGRWAVTPLIVFFPYARAEGLGKAFKAHGRGLEVFLATLVALASFAWLGRETLAPAAVALGVALVFALHVKRRLSGLTGDVYGAAVQLAGLAFLLAAVAR